MARAIFAIAMLVFSLPTEADEPVDCSGNSLQSEAQSVLPIGDDTSRKVEIAVEGETLAISLAAGQDVRFVRRFVLPPSCPARIQLVRAVVASWAGTTATVAVATDPPRLPSPRAVDCELDAAFVGSLAQTSFAAGGELSFRLTKPRAGWASRLSLLGQGPHHIALGGGSAGFGHAALGAGAGYRLDWRRLQLEFIGQAWLALLYVNGRDFVANYSAIDFDFGLSAALRGTIKWGPVRPFIAVELLGWLRPEQIRASGSAATQASLPQIEVLFVAGVGYDLWAEKKGRKKNGLR